MSLLSAVACLPTKKSSTVQHRYGAEIDCLKLRLRVLKTKNHQLKTEECFLGELFTPGAGQNGNPRENHTSITERSERRDPERRNLV